MLYKGWTIFKANERIKNYLLDHIRPVLGEQCNIEALDIALGAVHLKGVNIVAENQYYSLWIEDLRIGYSLTNLIKNGFQPKKSPQDILFVNPRLTITYIPKKQRVQPSISGPEFDRRYLDKMRDFDFLKRITVSHGTIVFADSAGQQTDLAQDISGWIVTRDVQQARARMVGKLFQSSRFNLRLNGEIDLVQSRLNFLEINLANYRWEDKIPLFVPEYFDIQDGRVNANITLSEKPNQEGFDIDGDLSIIDGAFKIKNQELYVSNMNLDAIIQDWDLVINNCSQTFNGSPVEINGRIKNLLDPVFNLKCEALEFDIGKFHKQYLPRSSVNLSALASLILHVKHSFRDPLVTAEVRCPQLFVGKSEFREINSQLTLHRSILSVNKLQTNFNELGIAASGHLDYSGAQENVSLRVNAIGKSPFNISLPSLANADYKLDCFLKGTFAQVEGNVVDFSAYDGDDELSSYGGDFEYVDHQLMVALNAKQHGGSVKAVIRENKNTSGTQVWLDNFHETVFQLPEFKPLKHILDWTRSEFEFTLHEKSSTIRGSYAWKNGKEHPPRFGTLDVGIVQNRQNREIIGHMQVKFANHNYDGRGDIIINPDSILIKKIEFDKLFRANGVIRPHQPNEIDANISLRDADLNYWYNIFALDSTVISSGEVSGDINITGQLKSPVVSGQLHMVDGTINQVDGFYADASFDVANDTLKLGHFIVLKDTNIVLNADGNYFLDSNQVAINVHADSVNLDTLIQTVANRNGILSGFGHADLLISGPPKNVNIGGTVRIGKGKLNRFPFDSVYVKLGDREGASNSNSPGLVISDGLIERRNEFKLHGDGLIPFSSSQNMDIQIDGTGNILSFLPDLTPFFKHTESQGTWQLHLTGSPGNFQLAGGEIKLEQGVMELADVAPKIKNITAHVLIDEDGFIRIHYINGTVKNNRFQFSNRKAASICNAYPLEPLFVPALGLDFGVLTIHTAPKGVPLHIPGLMANGEVGHFELVGKDSCESFYVAGPISNPLVRGKLNVRNANIMFPFANATKETDNLVVRILKSINWDVKAVPIKDARYEKDIPSGVDNVYVNLVIDSGVGGLDFQGIIADETFYVEGKLESSEGMVDYLDFNFSIEKAGVEFDKSNIFPIAYGSAKAVIADSMGMRNYIYLTLLLEDEESGQIRPRGRLNNIQFQLTSDNPNLGRSEGEIMASLGYSPSNIKEKATDIIGISTDNLLFRPLFRPFERQLERTLRLDLVRLSSRFARNLIEMNLWGDEYVQPYSKLFLFRSTRVMIGKYLADRVFLQYTGELDAARHYRHQSEELGLKHTLGLEYRINPNLLLEMEYNYNSFLIEREDKRIFLRHSFPIN